MVPAALDVPPGRPALVAGSRCIFVGSGAFHNLDGIRWFLDTCWSAIRQAVPQATLDIYGSICLRLGKVPDGVHCRGVIDDLTAAYAVASAAVIPLQMGSGLKIKLVEALAHGVPAVIRRTGIDESLAAAISRR